MENAQTDNSADCGQSRSTVGLGVDLPPGCDFTFHMSNAELAEAIDAAYQRVSKTGHLCTQIQQNITLSLIPPSAEYYADGKMPGAGESD